MGSFKLTAGPILRRVEPQRICIWVATDAAVSARAEVFELPADYQPGDGLARLGASAEGPPDARTVRLGERLYVTLLSVRPEEGAFPADRLLAYDLVLDGRRLADLGLLSGPDSLAYEGLPLPTFFIASEIASLLHGSCRNLGGTGLDAVPCGDELLARHALDVGLRPGLLILDGDQIYADHLPSPLIRHLTHLGNELMGWEEAVPGVDRRLADIPVDGRQELATEQAGFTSGGAQNQLLSFGEYAALYLVAWNRENWPADLPPYSHGDAATPIDVAKKAAEEVLKVATKTPGQKYADMVENLEAVRERVPAVRRLLANIPTYMIFDDHDVTDDLFLTRKWKESVRASPTGRRVVANALAAAWAFQCWGNDPDLYPDSFVKAIATHFRAQGDDPETTRAYEETIWDFADWTFHLPGRPVTVVMDTRTQRGYDNEEGAARLLGEAGLGSVAGAAERAGYRRGEPLVLVSPTPVVGYETIEGMQELVSRYVGPYRFDLESWRANVDGYVSFFKFLISELAPRNVILLSGDVHYGFTISATFTWRDRTLPVVQLTSSALKNTGLALRITELSSAVAGRTDRHFGWDHIAEDLEAVEPQASSVDSSSHAPQAAPRVKGRTIHVVQGVPEPMPANYAVDAELEEPEPARGKGALDWQDSRTFEPTWGYRSWPIVGENNLGLVRFRDGNLLVHRLLIPTAEGARSSTAIVSPVLGKLALVPAAEV